MQNEERKKMFKKAVLAGAFAAASGPMSVMVESVMRMSVGSSP